MKKSNPFLYMSHEKYVPNLEKKNQFSMNIRMEMLSNEVEIL